MGKHYETIELHILQFSMEDVIATSGLFDNPFVSDFYTGEEGDKDYE